MYELLECFRCGIDIVSVCHRCVVIDYLSIFSQQKAVSSMAVETALVLY